MGQQLDRARSTLHDVVTRALKITEDRTLPDRTKLARLEVLEPQIKAAEAEVADWEALEARKAQVFGRGDPGAFPSGQAHTPTGTAPSLVLPERVLKRLHEAAQQRSTVRLDLDLPPLGWKGPSDPEDWSASYVPPVLMPTVPGISEPQRIAGLYPATTMSGPSVQYPRITGRAGEAAVVAPGAPKPDIGILSEPLVAAAVKIAGICPVQDESLEDFRDFAAVVQAELQRAVIDHENYELLHGNGNTDLASGPLHMLGLLQDPDLLTRTVAAGETMADTLELAITDLRVGPTYAEADAIILNPNDWSGIRRLKDTAGRYIVDQDPTQAAPLSLWGVKVVPTTTMPTGTAIVGRFVLGGVLHVRRSLRVEAANTHADDWSHNRTTFRAELREVAAIKYPKAFVKVDLTATP